MQLNTITCYIFMIWLTFDILIYYLSNFFGVANKANNPQEDKFTDEGVVYNVSFNAPCHRVYAVHQ